MSKINILVKRPGDDWKQVTIEDELSEYQRIAGTIIMLKEDGEEFASIW